MSLLAACYCPNKMCSGILGEHKRTFQSLRRSDYPCPQCTSMSQVLNILFAEQTNSFFLKFEQGIYTFEETQKLTQDKIEDVYCLTCPNGKCVYLSTNKNSKFSDCKKCRACSRVQNNPFEDQTPTILLFGRDARKTSRDYQHEKPSTILKNFIRQSQPSTPKPEAKTNSFMA